MKVTIDIRTLNAQSSQYLVGKAMKGISPKAAIEESLNNDAQRWANTQSKTATPEPQKAVTK